MVCLESLVNKVMREVENKGFTLIEVKNIHFGVSGIFD